MIVRRVIVAVVLVCLTLCDLVVPQTDEFTLVETQYGYVRGSVLRNVDNGEYTSHLATYYAVPYATAQRFAKPTKDVSWSGVRETNWTHAKACPQGEGNFELTHPGWNDFSEDCLHMNIFTPFESSDPGPYPVMVWFHGGAFNSAGNIVYPGHFLATRGVVMASVNYRLNDFGFAYTGNDVCPGNFGLWDQAAALEFVRDNIANFGGDPTRVTIFGQSAGAASVGHHMMSPISQSLFHQTILESGTEDNVWGLNRPEQHPETYIWQIAEQLECDDPGFDDQKMIDCLRTKSWQEIVNASVTCTPGHFCQSMGPVIDGPGGFIVDYPENVRASGNINRGPIMAGHTHDDGSYYTVSFFPSSLLGGFNETRFHRYIRRLVSIWGPQMRQVNDTETKEKAFWSVEYNYTPWPYVDDEYANRDALNKILTDGAFGVPWDRLLKDHQQYSNSYGYVYNYRGRNAALSVPEWMGLPHGGEIPQVFGWVFLPNNPQVRQDTGIFYDFIDWTDEDREHGVFMGKLWTNFAKTGNPTPSPVTAPSGEEFTWRPYQTDDLAFMHVRNVSTAMETLYRQKDYAFWREYFLDYITNGYAVPLSIQMEDEEIVESLPEVAHEASFDIYRNLLDPEYRQRMQDLLSEYE